jgi:hypothetical protein
MVGDMNHDEEFEIPIHKPRRYQGLFLSVVLEPIL